MLSVNIFLTGHLNESDSFFDYSISNTSYSSINYGYKTHVPLFTEDVLSNASEAVLLACSNDSKCVYDYFATGSIEVALLTLDTAVKNREIVSLMSEFLVFTSIS